MRMQNILGSILIIDDDEDVLASAQLYLEHQQYAVRTESNPQQIPALLKKQAFDIILLDMNFEEDTTSGGRRFALAASDSGNRSAGRGGVHYGVW